MVLPITSTTLIGLKLVLATVPTLINLLHLVLVLLQGSLVVIKNDVLFWTAVLVVRRLLAVSGVLGWVAAPWSYIITSCPEALIIELAIVTIPFLLLRLHL